jgi:DNA-binding response OmpR family regulator
MIPIKILIVEDLANIRKMIDMSLPGDVFEKKFATDGKSGLDTYQAWHPEIILLDIGLPVVSGFNVLKMIREQYGDRNTAIIMETSQADKTNIIQCSKYGIQGYIAKPFSTADLAKKIVDYYGTVNAERAKGAVDVLAQLKTTQKQQSEEKKEATAGPEIEYMKELKLCLKEGPITEIQRKLLLRQAGKLGINHQRADELEKIAESKQVQYTEAEVEYMEEIDICMEGGKVSDDAKKILNRHRIKLGITDKRAIELEEAIAKKKNEPAQKEEK